MIHSDLKEEYLFLDSNGSDFGITKIDKKTVICYDITRLPKLEVIILC